MHKMIFPFHVERPQSSVWRLFTECFLLRDSSHLIPEIIIANIKSIKIKNAEKGQVSIIKMMAVVKRINMVTTKVIGPIR